MPVRGRLQPDLGISDRLLSEIQERVRSSDVRCVVLVEGLSDCFALEAAAARRDQDLLRAGVGILPMGGATNIDRFLREYGPAGRDVRLAGLCDLGEHDLFARSLRRAGVPSDGFFVCDRDLEDELIRALGSSRVERIIEQDGELASLRQLQQMPFHRERPTEEHLHRFMGVRSGRKYRYAPRLVEALEVEGLPRPLGQVLDFAVAT